MFLTILVFFLILSVLVLVHEIGHFAVAKRLGIKVEEFGFGLPPRIFGIKIGETTYSVNWLPIGGFVKLFGEEGESDIEGKSPKSSEVKHRAFYTRSPIERSLVIVAGVVMNFALAVTVISYLFTQGVMVPTDRIHIEKIKAGSPAEKTGLREKDIIRKFKVQSSKFKVDEKVIRTGEDLINNTKDHLGEEVILVIEREGKESEVSIIPRKDFPKDEGPMGIVISRFEERKYPWYTAPILGTKESLVVSMELVKGIGRTLWKLVTFQPVGKDVAGPIGIAQMTGSAVKSGENAVLELLGLLSLNLAIVNILPFPALDGGRLFFVVVEGLTGKKMKTRWERHIHQVGMFILLLLMLLVTLNDLVRILAK